MLSISSKWPVKRITKGIFRSHMCWALTALIKNAATLATCHVAKWCVNTTGKVTAHEDYDKFMAAKPEYTKEALMKRVPKKYHSIIEIFMKFNDNKMAEHQAKWNHEIYLEKSFFCKELQATFGSGDFSDEKIYWQTSWKRFYLA